LTPNGFIGKYNASHAKLAGGSKNPCSFIFDKKYDEVRCNPLLKSQSFSAMGLDKSVWNYGPWAHDEPGSKPM
jgi:hypothetical protein